MSKSQSTMRAVRRGNTKILFNPDTEQIEHYTRARNSGKFMRGSENLAGEQVDARAEKYEARAEELKAEQEAAEKKEIQKRARKLEA